MLMFTSLFISFLFLELKDIDPLQIHTNLMNNEFQGNSAFLLLNFNFDKFEIIFETF